MTIDLLQTKVTGTTGIFSGRSGTGGRKVGSEHFDKNKVSNSVRARELPEDPKSGICLQGPERKQRCL